MEHQPLFRRITQDFKTRFLQQEVTMYPTYAYRDPAAPSFWRAPVRVWVHDNRDTPFAEKTINRWAAEYFAENLGRPLAEDEMRRLEQRLEPFIADDKSYEQVEFSFAGDLERRVFRLAHRTSLNGVIEEHVQIPDALVQALGAVAQGGPERWLPVELWTTDGNGRGRGRIRFLDPEGISIVSDIDDTIKETHVPAGMRTVLQNTFLKEFKAAAGMRERYEGLVREAPPNTDVCFHYVSGSPWQLYQPLSEFLMDRESFPPGTFHLKNLRKNLLEAGSLESLRTIVVGGDLATLDQKVRQITNLMIHLPRRKFILVGDSGEKDPEVYRAIQRLFPQQVLRILIRDVLGERLAGMERITGPDVAVFLDTAKLEAEMQALVLEASAEAAASPKL